MNQTPAFKKDDTVFAKNFGRGANWMPGIIIDILSPKSFLVQVKDVVWKRHVDQLKHRQTPMENSSMVEEDVDSCKSLDNLHSYKYTGKGDERMGLTTEQQTDMQMIEFGENESDDTRQDESQDVVIQNPRIERRVSSRERKPTKRLIAEKYFSDILLAYWIQITVISNNMEIVQSNCYILQLHCLGFTDVR